MSLQPWPGRVFPYVVGESDRMQTAYALLTSVAQGDVNVCLQGEPGTGKAMIAETLHAVGPRRHRPYIALECTAATEPSMESQIGGRARGVCTLFLDEIGALPPHLQAKLLHALAPGIDVRVIAATERDVRHGLPDRLAAIHVELPPLRERTEDIPLIVAHVLRRTSALHGKTIRGVTSRALDGLIACAWPGNVRQLESVIERAIVLADTGLVDVGHLGFLTDEPMRAALGPTPGRLSLRELERLYILETLEHTRGNRARAARLLGISVRGLQYKLQRYLGESKTVAGVRAR